MSYEKKVEKLAKFSGQTFGMADEVLDVLFARGDVDYGLKKKEFMEAIEEVANRYDADANMLEYLGGRLLYMIYRAHELDVQGFNIGVVDPCECCECGGEF